MDGQLGVMIDVEEALYKLKGKNLYTAGLSFFYALGYPVEPLEIAINESMFRFVYVISKNHCIFSSDETHAMQSVASISWLFTLSNDIKALRHVGEARINDIQISSINYFCVELDCNFRDRSIQAFVLTKIISKVVNTPVVVLFKHDNHMLLSSAFMEYEGNTSFFRTYLSDWYLIDPIQEDVLMTLSNWYFGNYCVHNFYIFFIDWIHSMARPYFLNSKSYEYVKFEQNSFSLSNQPYFVDGVRYSCPSERVVELDSRQHYGYDYVTDEDSIEIFIKDNNWTWEELVGNAAFNDDCKEESDDEEDKFDPKSHKHQEDMKEPSIDINCIDDDVFSNPIKLLEYLKSLEHREQNEPIIKLKSHLR